MKDYSTILGERSGPSSVFAVIGLRDRSSLIEYIRDRFDDNVVKAIELFKLNSDAKGWLIISKSRIIFYINQDTNEFKEKDYIKWVVDDLDSEKLLLKQTDENEVEIFDNKKILFDPKLISKERLIAEISKNLKTESENKTDSYSKTQEDILSLANRVVGNTRKIGYLSSRDRTTLNSELTEYLMKKMLNAELSLKEFEYIVDCAIKSANKDVGNTRKIGYLSSNDRVRMFTEKFNVHLQNLISAHNKKPVKSDVKENNLSLNELKMEKFISIPGLDNFYQRLIKEINHTYQNETYTSTLILCRKLIENLLIDLLRKKFGSNTKEDVEIYYNTKDGRFHDFTYLVKNFEERKEEFLVDKELVEEFVRLVKPFRKGANSKTHSIIHFVGNKEDLIQFNIGNMADLLMRLMLHN